MQKTPSHLELLDKEMQKEINSFRSTEQHVFTYDHFIKQGAGCENTQKDEPSTFFVIQKDRVLRYKDGIITETAIGNHDSTPYQEPITLNIRNPLRSEVVNLKLIEMFEAMITQLDYLEIRYRVLFSFYENSVKKNKKKKRLPTKNTAQSG